MATPGLRWLARMASSVIASSLVDGEEGLALLADNFLYSGLRTGLFHSA